MEETSDHGSRWTMKLIVSGLGPGPQALHVDEGI